MKLIRGPEVTKKQHRDVYKFHLDFMIGDADGSDNIQLYISPNNPYIEIFLKFLGPSKPSKALRACNATSQRFWYFSDRNDGFSTVRQRGDEGAGGA